MATLYWAMSATGSASLVGTPQTLPEDDGGPTGAFARVRRDLAAGLGFVRSRHGMLSFLFMAATVNFLMMPILVLLPFYSDRVLGRGAAWYGSTIVQLATPAGMRGRVIGLLVTLASAATPIGLGLGGVLGDLTGHRTCRWSTCSAAG